MKIMVADDRLRNFEAPCVAVRFCSQEWIVRAIWFEFCLKGFVQLCVAVGA